MVTAASERLREETNLLAGGYGLVMAENGEKVKRLKRANRGGGTIHGLVVTSFPIPDTGTQTSADKFLDDSGVENVHRAIGGDMTNRVVFGRVPAGTIGNRHGIPGVHGYSKCHSAPPSQLSSGH